LAGLLGLAVSFHYGASVSLPLARGGDGKVASALGNLCSSGLGVIVVVLARHLLRASAARPFASMPGGDTVNEPSGGSPLARLRARGEQQRLDVVALVWMVFVLTVIAVTIYSVLRFGNILGNPGDEDWWLKLRLLAQSGGTVAIFGGVVGVGLAVVFEGPSSRLALRLATVAGMWAGIAGVVGGVVSFHGSASFPATAFDGRVAGALIYAASAGLGVIVATVAWRFSQADAPADIS
jgi:hypothetical protein